MKKFFKKLAVNLLLLFFIIVGIEWWQGQKLFQGRIPNLKNFPLLNPPISDQADIYLLYVWAPWCGVCKVSAGNLAIIKNLGLESRSLALAYEGEASVHTFMQDTGLAIATYLGTDDLMEHLQISAFPTYYLITKDGTVLKGWQGYTTTVGIYLRYHLYLMLFRANLTAR